MKTLLTALLLLYVTQAADARASVSQDAQRVDRLLQQWRIAEAQKVLEKLVQRAADHPSVIAARARVLFHLGHYSEARDLLQGLLKEGRSRSGELRRLAKLYASTAETLAGHVVHSSAGGNFRFYVPPGKEELLVPFAGATLEALRARIAEDLGYEPTDPIRVEVFARPEQLARVSTLTEADIRRSGTIALCKYNRIMVVSPRALLRGYGWRDTLAHEYIHLVVSRLSRNRVPIWLHEGLAKFFEARWRLQSGQQPPLSPTQRHLLARALRRNKLIPWQRMHPSMAKLPDQKSTALAFAQVQTAVGFLSRSSPIRLRRLIDSVGKGKSAWQAVRAVSGLDAKRFQRAWKSHLRKLELRTLPGLEPKELRFGKNPSTEEQIGAIAQRKARKFFRLADMLRQRRLTRAAILEYEKASALVGPRDSFVANALARAYLELEQPDKAVRALLPVIEYYPELPGPQTTLGVAYIALDDKAAAADHLRVSLRINPFNPELHCGLAHALPAGAEREQHDKLCQQLRR